MKRAVVVGAGVGGLAAAAALAGSVQEVVVLEKDRLEAGFAPRKGVGQGGHLHSLLLGGLQQLELLYPTIRDDLSRAGAVQLRAGLDQQIHELGAWMPDRDLGFRIFAQSRTLLEEVMRERTRALPNVEIVSDARVEALQHDGEAINSVRFARAKTEGATDEIVELSADLVVDASGSGGHFVKQLAPHFEGIDTLETIASNIVYSSAFLTKPDSFRDRYENILMVPEPTHSAGGALLDVGHNQWCVSLHGRNGVMPPLEEAEWREFAKRLPDTRIWERLQGAEVLGKIRRFNKPISTWRRFDLAKRLPRAYFPLGDTITSVNPIFGQGMTVAFGHAVALRDALGNRAADLQAAYLKGAMAWSLKAWRRGSAYDQTFLKPEALQSKNVEALRRLALERQRRAHEDPEVHAQLVRQAQLLA